MSTKSRTVSPAPASRLYWGSDVPMRVIRRFARQVAERFQPDKIILFGSHAYGTPHADSDVDILVIMPCRNQLDQAFRIHVTIDPPFPVHVVVRTPYNMRWRLREGESFLTEVMAKGKVLYEKADQGVAPKGRSRATDRGTARNRGRHHRSARRWTDGERAPGMVLAVGQRIASAAQEVCDHWYR